MGRHGIILSPMKRALVIRHVEHEGIAAYRDPIEAAGYTIDRVAAWEPGVSERAVLAPDLVVSMGGPMGVYDADRLPWLAAERDALRARIVAGRPTLGVCLGAQLIASALGARVHKGPAREIGFAPLTLTAAGRASAVAALAGVPVLHWHGDTFDLPEGATLLARTALYPQAFAVGHHVLALQFHAEMGEDARFAHWLVNDAAEIVETGQIPAALQAQHDGLGPGAVAAGRAMLTAWLNGLAERSAPCRHAPARAAAAR